MLFYFTSSDEEVQEFDEEVHEEAETEVTERQEGEDSKEGEEIEVPTEITSENEDIVDESMFKEIWGKLTIGKHLTGKLHNPISHNCVINPHYNFTTIYNV